MGENEFFSRTQAFNFLKKMLEVPKKVLINKNFFFLFFSEPEKGQFILKKSEDVIKNIFTEQGLAELNKVYYEKKKSNELSEAKKISTSVLEIVGKSLAA
jgi:hypothetical protein